jgi:hypothetical protein
MLSESGLLLLPQPPIFSPCVVSVAFRDALVARSPAVAFASVLGWQADPELRPVFLIGRNVHRDNKDGDYEPYNRPHHVRTLCRAARAYQPGANREPKPGRGGNRDRYRGGAYRSVVVRVSEIAVV